MADWQPKSATPVTDANWMPASARRVVREHTRRPPGVAQQIVQGGVEALPAMGGVAGGLLGTAAGPLGAVGGAGLGGVAGQAARLALRPLVGLSDVSQPPSVAQQAGSLLGAGLTQAGAEVGGAALSAGARLGGRALMRAALAPTRALRQEFPQLAETAVQTGTLVGGRPQVSAKGISIVGGAPKVNALRQASTAAEDELLRAANQNGVQIPLQDIAQPLIDNADAYILRTQGRHITGDEAASILGTVRKYAEDKLSRQSYGAGKLDVSLLSPEQAQVLKQEAQREIKPLMTARRMGNVPAGNPDLAAAVEQATRGALYDRVPGLQDQAATTQKLIGLRRAVLRRELGPQGSDIPQRAGEWAAAHGMMGLLGAGGLAYGAMTGGSPTERIARGLTMAGAGAALGSPQALSLAALLAANPALGVILQQSPRLMGAAAQNWSQP